MSATDDSRPRLSVLTIADALELPVLREGVPEVLAGHRQLPRPIRWVHSGEFPDMPAVLKGGELLLTHGMSIRTQQSRQRRYIADLARAGLAGLIIELGSPIRRVPAQVIDEARRHDLPLIVLHRPIPWIEVTEAIHRTIVRRQDALIERGQELHDRFARLVAAGAGVADMLNALADTVGNPVVLTRDGEIVYSASREHHHAAIASAWDGAARQLPDAPAAITVPVSVVDDPAWGSATVLGLERALDPFDRLALERAAPMLAFAFLRAHETEMLAARERGEFLEALIDREAPLANHQAYRRAASIGFIARSSWLLPIAADLAAGFGRLDEGRWALVGRHVRQELESRQTPAVVGTLSRERHLAVVVGLANLEQSTSIASATADAVQRAVLQTGSDAPVVVCAGLPRSSWRELRDALRDTIDALPAMRQAPPRPWHDVSRPGLRTLLWALRGERALAEFVDRTLEPLHANDAGRQSQLLHTLEAFCAHGSRKAETARALHLERQSLYKRLAKIEAILNVDLDDEDARLGLHLALRARRLLGGAGLGPQRQHHPGHDAA